MNETIWHREKSLAAAGNLRIRLDEFYPFAISILLDVEKWDKQVEPQQHLIHQPDLFGVGIFPNFQWFVTRGD